MSEQRQTTEELRPESQRRGVYDWFVSLFSDEPETRAELLEMLRDAAERSAAGSGAEIVTIDHLRRAQATKFLQQES